MPDLDGRSEEASSNLEALKELRAGLIRRLAAEGVSGDPLAVDSIGRRIGQLSRAIETLEQSSSEVTKKTERHKRRMYGTGMVVCVVLVSGSLLLSHRPVATVAVDTYSTTIGFTLSEPKAIFDGLNALRSVEISGLARVTQDDLELAVTLEPTGLTVRIDCNGAGRGKPGQQTKKACIGLGALMIPEGSPVQFAESGVPHEIAVRFPEPPTTIKIATKGEVLISVSGHAPKEANFTAPVAFVGSATKGAPIVMTLAFDGSEAVFETPMVARRLDWRRPVRDVSPVAGIPLEETSITSGRINLKEFKDRTAKLETGVSPEIGMGAMTIRRLSVNGSTIHCLSDGTVSELSLRDGEISKNLMPTWLAWVRERDGVVQFWAGFAYVCGLGFAIWQWWRDPK